MPNTDRPILIAGPTASGKSALALRLAQACNGCIINADAIQVYDCWHLLSARPSPEETAQAPHHLYGHIGKHTPYSTGHWLLEVKATLSQAAQSGHRPIVIGGTGLYFSALTQGLVEIPPIPNDIRIAGNTRRETHGKDGFLPDLQRDDPATLLTLDQNNPARLQRAWEVWQATGKGLSAWQAETPPPLIDPTTATKILLNADRDWLADRIARRFQMMMDSGALDEVRSYIADGWDATIPSAQAIGARELVAHLQGTESLSDAMNQATIQTRQYAKRQRTWFRSKMKDWHSFDPAYPLGDKEFHKFVQTSS